MGFTLRCAQSFGVHACGTPYVGHMENKATMKQIWAPWRMDYIKGPKPAGCVLCEKHKTKRDQASLVLARGVHAFVMLNLYPYSNGHLMISPYAHADALEALPDAVMGDLVAWVRTSVVILKRAYKPEGINIGLNLGRAAGAGIDDHLHFHVVPRWGGDTNFMSVVAGTRVIPEGLDATYRLLKPYFSRRGRSPSVRATHAHQGAASAALPDSPI